MGVEAEAKREWDEAVLQYTVAIELNPDFTEAFYNRGNIWLARRDYDHALADFDEAIKQNPFFIDALNNRSTAWYLQGAYDESISDSDRVIALDPANAPAFNNRGMSWASKGHYDKAIFDYTKAISILPQHDGAFRNRAVTWAHTGDFDKAINDYSRVIDLHPGDAACLNDRGILWARKGEYAKALADFTHALKLNPNDAVVAKNLNLVMELADRATGAEVLAPPDQNDDMVTDCPAVHDRRSEPEPSSQGASAIPLWQLFPPSPPQARTRTKRVALLIGNSQYSQLRSLEHPARDVKLIELALKDSGFSTVMAQTDLTLNGMIRALQDFASVADEADHALLYYSGHAIQVAGGNYLVPVDAGLRSDRDADFETIDASRFQSALAGAAQLRVLVLDACRESTLELPIQNKSGRPIERGLCYMNAQPGEVIVFSERVGQVVPEWEGTHSPFAEAFSWRLRQMREIEVRKFFDFVRDDVFELTFGKQQSVIFGSLPSGEDLLFKST